jgi:hypothetical protein
LQISVDNRDYHSLSHFEIDGSIKGDVNKKTSPSAGSREVFCLGRPYIYGLGAEGESGVTKVVNILQREFQMAMVLTGRTNIGSIDRSVI